MTVRATPASAADRRGASQAINLWDLREAGFILPTRLATGTGS